MRQPPPPSRCPLLRPAAAAVLALLVAGCLATSAHRSRELLIQGNDAVRASRYAEAVRLFRKAAKTDDPGLRSEALFSLGRTYEMQVVTTPGTDSQALGVYLDMIDELPPDPFVAAAYKRAIKLHLRAERHAKAERLIRQALDAGPPLREDEFLLQWIALARRQKDVKLIRRLCDRIIATHPNTEAASKAVRIKHALHRHLKDAP